MGVDRRLLLVHAHPDDETINNGATMARYAAAGVEVTLLTCTLGEYGDILVPGLVELGSDRGNQLGGYRALELDRAMAALGVTDHRFLGGPGRFQDSGMIGSAENDAPRVFWLASSDPAVFAAAVRAAVGVIRAVRPHVVVTYDEKGGYGHPDHIMAHRVTMAAVDAAADPGYDTESFDTDRFDTDRFDTDRFDTDRFDTDRFDTDRFDTDRFDTDREGLVGGDPWDVPKLYWNVLSRSLLDRGLDAIRRVDTGFIVVETVDDLPYVAEDATVTTVIDANDHCGAKVAAMRAHASQILVEPPFFALSDHLGAMICGTEQYRLVRGTVSGPFDADGHEVDLFAGVDG